MLTVLNLCSKSFNCANFLIVTRTKTKVHWAKLKRKTGPTFKAVNHFDDFYGSVFGNAWKPMREAMQRKSKYVALVNNYANYEETIEFLTNRGAHCLGKLMSVQKDFQKENNEVETIKSSNTDSKLERFMDRVQSEDISSVYHETGVIPDKLDVGEVSIHNKHMIDSENNSPIAITNSNVSSQTVIGDVSRIIEPEFGMSPETLYQYVPATKLIGADDWVPESLHYSYYQKGKDFPLVIEPETEFKYPEHLKVYTYEMDSEDVKFPEPRRCKTGVINYYPMDCGSVVSALALCLSGGERVLDMCSAPGGKALVALQTLLPGSIVCNDSSISRANRIEHIFGDYLIDFKTNDFWRERVQISRVDGRDFVDDQGFDKVLVDVPCTTDRKSMREDENNVFRADRIRERLRLPEVQSALLINALRLVRPGGHVVYSTCSLSPIQNDGVVNMALKQAFQEHGIVAKIKDLSHCMSGLSSTLKFASGDWAPQYGLLVIPSINANFGPSYISRLERVK